MFLQRFTTPTNTVVASDVVPAITIDHNNRLVEGITTLQNVLGITEMVPMSAGVDIKIYKMTQVNTPNQPSEGDTIALTEIKREVAKTISLTLKKYRKVTTAEAIQKTGKNVAINMTDDKLMLGVQKALKADFFSAIQPQSGSTSATAGTNLQTCLANIWAKAQEKFEDYDVDMVYFVNPADLAPYLGTATITVQNTFGFKYIEDFLGLGTVIVSTGVTATYPVGTPKQNLCGAYAPIGGEVATEFGLTADQTGLVGMTHSANKQNATIETLLMSNVVFYPEATDGIVKGSITSEEE